MPDSRVVRSFQPTYWIPVCTGMTRWLVPASVIPAKAGIQRWLATTGNLNPGVGRGDGESFYMSDRSYPSVHRRPWFGPMVSA